MSTNSPDTPKQNYFSLFSELETVSDHILLHERLSRYVHDIRSPLTTIRNFLAICNRLAPSTSLGTIDRIRASYEGINFQNDTLANIVPNIIQETSKRLGSVGIGDLSWDIICLIKGNANLGKLALEEQEKFLSDDPFFASYREDLIESFDWIVRYSTQILYPENEKPEPIDLRQLLRSVERVYSRRISLLIQHKVGLPKAFGNKTTITEIIGNILNNAEKYGKTPASNQAEINITTSFDQEKQEIVILISDHGTGIPPDKLEEIFIPNVRLDIHKLAGIEGTGKGLAIARQLAQSQGGWVSAKNKSNGQGACFTFTIPIATTE